VSSVTDMRAMFQDAKSFNRKLCAAAWVRSKASKNLMFKGSPGSISTTVCPTTTRRYVTRRPVPDRELIFRTSIATSVSTAAITSTIANTMTCSKCGTFGKSGRVSCCAPGGAWFKNCGGAGNRNVDHRWFEGVDACKPATMPIGSVCAKCGTMEKSGKSNCCGRGGSWFRNCGSAGNAKLRHTWSEGIQACTARAQSKTVIGQQLNTVHHKNMDSCNRAGLANSKAVIKAVKTFTFASPTSRRQLQSHRQSPRRPARQSPRKDAKSYCISLLTSVFSLSYFSLVSITSTKLIFILPVQVLDETVLLHEIRN